MTNEPSYLLDGKYMIDTTTNLCCGILYTNNIDAARLSQLNYSIPYVLSSNFINGTDTNYINIKTLNLLNENLTLFHTNTNISNLEMLSGPYIQDFITNISN